MTLKKYRLSEKEEFPEIYLITTPTIHDFPVDVYLCADVDKVVDKLEGGMASITDAINTELRENYGAAFQVEKYDDPEALKIGIRKLVDCIKSAHKADLARVTAELEKANELLARNNN